MQPRVVRGDSCCGGQADETPFDARAELGQRRRLLLRRVTLACSTGLALAAVVVSVTGGAVSGVLADRFAWAASVWAVGLVLGWVRDAVTARRPDWRLAACVVAMVIGIGWQPLVPAFLAVALLAERVIRAPVVETPGAGRGLSLVAGQLG